MGKGGAAPGQGQPAVAPPPLPANLPQDLRDFIECRADVVRIANGPVDWIDVPEEARQAFGKDTKAQVQITPGAGTNTDVATADLKISVGPLSATVPMAIHDGKLLIDSSGLPDWAPAAMADELDRFQNRLNAWLAANGRKLAPPYFSDGGILLTKVPAVAPAPQPGSTLPPPPEPIIPPQIDLVPDISGGEESFDPPSRPEPEPEPGVDVQELFAALTPTPAPKPQAPSEPMAPLVDPDPEPEEPRDALDAILQGAASATGFSTGPKAEVTGQPATGDAPVPSTGSGGTPPARGPSPVVGAGGPGGPNAPKGLGDLARYAIAATIVAALGLGAFIFLGNKGPAPVATAVPSVGGTIGPVETPAGTVAGPVVTPAATAGPATAAPGAPVVIFTDMSESDRPELDDCQGASGTYKDVRNRYSFTITVAELGNAQATQKYADRLLGRPAVLTLVGPPDEGAYTATIEQGFGGNLTLIFDGKPCQPDGYSTLGSLTVEGLALEVQSSGLRMGPLPE